MQNTSKSILSSPEECLGTVVVQKIGSGIRQVRACIPTQPLTSYGIGQTTLISWYLCFVVCSLVIMVIYIHTFRLPRARTEKGLIADLLEISWK